MIYRITKPKAGYILFYASPEPLESIHKRYPGSTVTESSIDELKAFQALADRSYQELTEPPKRSGVTEVTKPHRRPRLYQISKHYLLESHNRISDIRELYPKEKFFTVKRVPNPKK